MCARSGEYLTIDTSWSSFVNPWSRKVAFVVGRHKVRTSVTKRKTPHPNPRLSAFALTGPDVPDSRSPLNEDVFAAPPGYESRVTTPDVIQLSEQIHRILAQPVHNGGSQGYSSLGSSGSRGSHRSRQQHLSAASSSDSNGPAMDEAAGAVALHKPVSPGWRRRRAPAPSRRAAAAALQLWLLQMTFQQICKDVHMVKTNGQQVFIESRNRPAPRKNTAGKRKDRSRASPGALHPFTSGRQRSGDLNVHSLPPPVRSGPANIRAVPSDPIRSLIADAMKPPNALLPAPLLQKEAHTGYSYQQINCLDSIIR